MKSDLFLLRLGKSRKRVIGKYNSLSEWRNHIATVKIPNSFDSREQFLHEAEVGLMATMLEFRAVELGIKSFERPNRFRDDVTFIGECNDESKVAIRVITDLRDGEVITRNSKHLSGVTVVSVIHFGVSPVKKDGFIVIADADYHETLTKQWAPGVSGSAKLISKKELAEFFNGNTNFWNYYRKVISNFVPTTEAHVKIQLEDWQLNAVSACLGPEKSGGIYFGTGGGKTLVFSYSLSEAIRMNSADSIYVVITPSLLLTGQTLKVVVGNVTSKCKYLRVCSDDTEYEELEAQLAQKDLMASEIPSTTDVNAISRMVQDSQQKNVPLVIVVTYKSLVKVHKALNGQAIKMLIVDEAHNLVKGQLCGKPRMGGDISDLEYVEMLESQAEKIRYFTATPPDSYDGRVGFSLDEKYKTLYSISNKELIARGCITPLSLVVVDVANILTKNQSGAYDLEDPHAATKVIQLVFKDAQKRVLERSKSPEDNAIKMLVKLPSSKYLQVFEESDGRKEINREASTYTISSLYGLYINGQKYEGSDFREKYLDEQHAMTGAETSLTAYVEMLGEGIDVQKFNVFLSFEPILDEITRTQTFGRVRRAHPEDRKMIRDEKLTADRVDSFRENGGLQKPYAYVYILKWGISSADYKKEVMELIKSEFVDDEIDPSVKVIVPDQLPAGSPDGGQFQGFLNVPRDFSNISTISLDFSTDDMEKIRKEVREERSAEEVAYQKSLEDMLAVNQYDAFFDSL